MPQLQKQCKKFPPPAMLLIQLGSNDLTSIKSFDLISDIVRDILRIKLLLSNTKVVLSNVLMRRYWHGADDGTAVERARKRVNCAVKKELIPEGFCVIRHLNIRAREKNLHRYDSTHLSDAGNDIYLNNIQGALEYFPVSDKNNCFPPE